jgi:hypothetical protein
MLLLRGLRHEFFLILLLFPLEMFLRKFLGGLRFRIVIGISLESDSNGLAIG